MKSSQHRILFLAIVVALVVGVFHVGRLPHAATPTLPWHDILDVPSNSIAALEHELWGLANACYISNKVVDFAVVGSFAQGYAAEKPGRTSDLDIVVFVNGHRFVPFCILHDWRPRVARALNLNLAIEISIQPAYRMQKDNCDWIAYSITERHMYGRPNGKPRAVKLVWCNERWYAIDKRRYRAVEEYQRQFHAFASCRMVDDHLVFFGESKTTTLLSVSVTATGYKP